MTTRRQFLKGATLASAAILAPQVLANTDGVALRSMAHPYLPHKMTETEEILGRLDKGFGLAQVKCEGQPVRYDIKYGSEEFNRIRKTTNRKRHEKRKTH